MQINPRLIKTQFEKSFETYDKNAVVQHLMAQRLVEELLKINKNFPVILELGSGTGLLTAELVKKISFKKYFANDLIEKSKKYITKIVSVAEFYHGNALKIKPSCKPDLIISNAIFSGLKPLKI